MVPVRDGKDRKELRKGYDTYLPADAANYDDWNELFQDVERLVEALPFLKVIQPPASCMRSWPQWIGKKHFTMRR